ncbi:uracil-DNA glycosylase [Vulcanisaeta souniana JCM 11219]|uniref:Type-5 uracil-DNA glycosylase n=1 Tax=Vulcanisaeta souniana JCM 11219 TaxID=1293586 RepID=A0A830EG73_9CREN|nr:uracil-DNA glycosylase [Vulcanisaeta souniana JCM 11219]
MSWYNDFVSRLIQCRACPRLVGYRESVKPLPRFMRYDYWRRPVPPWGDLGNARIMIVGLAPAAHGGNRTGRMFTGDSSAQFLFRALYEAGLSNKPYSISRDDGVAVRCVYITSVVKCAPPNNRPSNEEIRTCVNNWFRYELEYVRPRAIIALGHVAFLGIKLALGIRAEFRHNDHVDFSGIRIFMSYHPSPRNTNTGRLKMEDLVSIFRMAMEYAGCVLT